MVKLDSNVVCVYDAECEATRLIEFDTPIDEGKRETIATVTANYIQKVNDKVVEECVSAVVLFTERYVKFILTINDLIPYAHSELEAIADGLVEQVNHIGA